MDNQAIIKRLEKAVIERTPRYDDIEGRFGYDENLMRYNYLLTILYLQEHHVLQARISLKKAIHQLICFNETLEQEITPVNCSEENIDKYPTPLEISLEQTRKRYNDGKKFYKWSKKIFRLEYKLG